MAQQSIRDQIRSATLGVKPQFKTEQMDYNGVTVEFKQPDLKSRKLLLRKAKDSEGNFDIIEFLVFSVITCTFEPGTNNPVFTMEDYDVLMGQSAGGFIEKFGNKISELMQEDDADEKNG